MATLTVDELDRLGFNLDTLVAADVGGDEFANDGQMAFVITNGDASPHTVTFVTQQTVDDEAVADKAVVVAAGDTMIIGPFPTSVYNDANSKVQATYDAVTSVTVGVFRLIKNT